MARLLPGENAKIDNINELVRLVQQGNKNESNESLTALLDLFNPLLLKLCDKWSNYFNDKDHHIKPFSDLMGDCIYWFYYYTKDIYTIDGRATYNKFIKDHIDQRIRYIYECEIKYYKKLLFPDPYKGSDMDNKVNDSSNGFDDVINKYCNSGPSNDIEHGIVENVVCGARGKLVNKILGLLECETFNDRERTIFVEIVCNGKTHEQMGEEFGISRTRVTQILAKIKDKLYKKMEECEEIWQLLDDADIDITNKKMM